MARFRKTKTPIPQEPPLQPSERVTRSTSEMILNNFIGGVFWAIGTVIGLSLFLFVIGVLANYVNIIPVIGDFIADILNYLQTRGTIQH